MKPLIVVLGPTGSGKSDLSLAIAAECGGEVVSCDSVQVYKGLDVGSAKVPPAERQGIPHHLIDILSVGETISAGEYSRLAREAVTHISSRDRLPIVTGGTGLYLRALLEGLSPAPPRDPQLRARLRELAERRPLLLHRFLRIHDPVSSRRIHPNDIQKLIRAVELSKLACRPASATQAIPRRPLTGFRVLKFGLDPNRKDLYEKLNGRATWMFSNGLLEETRRVLSVRPREIFEPLNSLGYTQAVCYLTGACSLEDAIADCQLRTRNYAKRQMTWFRREPEVYWLKGFGSELEIQETAVAVTRKFLAGTGTI